MMHPLSRTKHGRLLHIPALLLAAALLLLNAAPTLAQICHDNLWPDGEFCGYDAYVVTGEVDMNHDCVVDFLDVALFFPQFGMFGPNVSADIDGDGMVNLSDASYLASSLFSGNAVTPCNPTPANPDTCAAELALSFDPNIIVSRERVAAVTFTNFYVIASGWSNASAVEFGIETSPNVWISNNTAQSGWSSMFSFNNGNRYYYSLDNTGTPSSGVTNLVTFQFMVTDASPATVKLIDYDVPNSLLNRWAPSTLDAHNEFKVRRNLGINTIDPVSVTACPNPNVSPNLAITNPATDIVVPYGASPYPLAGTALDMDGTLSFVEYRVNSGAWHTAGGTSSWSASVPLIVGANWIQVRTADTLGAYSSTQVVTITRLDAPDLTISTWTAPDSLWTGCGQLAVTATCENLSPMIPAGPSRLGFYLSSDSTIDATDFLIGSVDLLGIPASQDTTVNPTFAIPDSGPRGIIYFGVLADDLNAVAEGNENNNDASSAFEFPVPAITTILDVANDQGRAVRIHAWASARDALGSATPILQYEIFRRVDALPKQAPPSPDWAAPQGVQVSSPAKLAGWEFAGAIPAHGESEYNMIMPTLADSTDQGMHYSVFFVRAATSAPLVFFDSCPDSGYSVDNLPPSVPSGMLVAYSASGNELSWEPSLDVDFRYFRIYRGSDESFDPSPSNLVAATTDTDWLDTASNPWSYFYRMSAVDHSGNESPTTAPSVVTNTPDTPTSPTSYALYPCVPNPFNPRTQIRYDLPVDSFVKLGVYAGNGRLVCTLVSEDKPAGTHEVAWEGRDRFGSRVATGLYFYRLEAGNYIQTRRMVLLK